MNPLNSPLEVGIRSLVILTEAFPRRFDVAQLVYLDHAMLHSGALDGGPTSLHPDLPAGPGELSMRRHLIEQGLIVLMRASLADMTADAEGFLYGATEEAASFLEALEAPYVGELADRATWLVAAYLRDDANVREDMKQITKHWTSHYNATAHDGRRNEVQ